MMVYDSVVNDFVFRTGRGFSTDIQDEILSRAKENKGEWLETFGVKCKPVRDEEKYTFMCIPLRAHNRLVGGFCTLTETVKDLAKEDIELISVVATQMALAIENSMLYEMTKKLALTDDLTRLYNYRYFRKSLSNELGRTKRYKRPLALIMLDLDDFKEYNDNFGHPKGDGLLKEVGRLLARCCRESDVVARYGGEEFAAILPETDEQGALAVAEKIRKLLEAHHFSGAKKRDQHITISLGIAQNSEKLSSTKDLIKAADEALYKSKREGKNRTTIAKR